MTDIVDETLKRWRQSVFAYGATDCLLSIGDYVRDRRPDLPDRAAAFRGTYGDEAGARAAMAAHGGPEGLIASLGLAPIDLGEEIPCRGDVVVLDTGTNEGCVGALCTGEGVAARLERGVIEVDIRFVKITHAWKIVE